MSKTHILSWITLLTITMFSIEVNAGHHFGQRLLSAKMVNKLELTASQQTRIKAVLKTSKQKAKPYKEALKQHKETMKQLLNADTFDRRAVRELIQNKAPEREELELIRAQTKFKIRKVLTKKQAQTLAEMRKNKRKRRFGKKP